MDSLRQISLDLDRTPGLSSFGERAKAAQILRAGVLQGHRAYVQGYGDVVAGLLRRRGGNADLAQRDYLRLLNWLPEYLQRTTGIDTGVRASYLPRHGSKLLFLDAYYPQFELSMRTTLFQRSVPTAHATAALKYVIDGGPRGVEALLKVLKQEAKSKQPGLLTRPLEGPAVPGAVANLFAGIGTPEALVARAKAQYRRDLALDIAKGTGAAAAISAGLGAGLYTLANAGDADGVHTVADIPMIPIAA